MSFRNHRFHALCPYFAMFPPEFVARMLKQVVPKTGIVLDPFSGRGTTILESLLNSRTALACDINPVAYCVSAAKAHSPSLEALLHRIKRLERAYRAHSTPESEQLPEFFIRCFNQNTLSQLVYLRRVLRWKTNTVDRFIAALVLGHLHGETDRSAYYLSNQMPHTISTKPGYSVRYWAERRLAPPARDAFALLRNRAQFRFADGIPPAVGVVKHCDARRCTEVFAEFENKISAVITSPPYLDVTNYEEDQWLRLWFLGGAANPTYGVVGTDDRHSCKETYWDFLKDVWESIAPLLRRKAVLVCRIGGRGMTLPVLEDYFMDAVEAVWSSAIPLARPRRTSLRKRQTKLLNASSVGCRFEVDFCVQV
jgi:DNA methylase